MQSLRGQPIYPLMCEMPDASDVGACELLPNMDPEEHQTGGDGQARAKKSTGKP